jgi:hypothetical protein
VRCQKIREANVKAATLFVLLLFLAGSGAHAQQVTLPPAGDCAAFAAQFRGGGYWVGIFSGSYPTFSDQYQGIGGQGCFRSERECRRWLNEAQTAAPEPAAMSCRKAAS